MPNFIGGGRPLGQSHLNDPSNNVEFQMLDPGEGVEPTAQQLDLIHTVKFIHFDFEVHGEMARHAWKYASSNRTMRIASVRFTE
jgi:hypothetical protein